jgi:hypothetical protein
MRTIALYTFLLTVSGCSGQVLPDPIPSPASAIATPSATNPSTPPAPAESIEPCINENQCTDPEKLCIAYRTSGPNVAVGQGCFRPREVCPFLTCGSNEECFVRDTSPPLITCVPK